MNRQQTINSISDKNDALEAFKTFSGARSLFFWILLIAMLVLQVIFWMVDSGKVDSALPRYETSQPKPGGSCPKGEAVLLMVADQQDKTDKNPTPPAEKDLKEEKQAAPQNNLPPTNEKLAACETAGLLINSLKIVKYVATVTVVLYCLSLLIGVKLALIGQLGGMANAAKAFFLSLILMVFIVPWQDAISPEIPGVLFGYKELALWYQQIRIDGNSWGYGLYYGRFVGFWAFSIIVMLVAQLRSYQSVKQIRQRIIALQQQNDSPVRAPGPTADSDLRQTETLSDPL